MNASNLQLGQCGHFCEACARRDDEIKRLHVAHDELVAALELARVALANAGHHTGVSGTIIKIDIALAKAKGE